MDGDEQANNHAERRRRFASAWWVIGIACLLATVIVIAKWVHANEVHRMELEAIANLNTLQLEIERYRVEHGEYPPSVAENGDWVRTLQSESWYNLAMTNPFSGEPVRLVPFAQRGPGEITYIQIPAGTYPGEFDDECYYLITYCGEGRLGYDINSDDQTDGVLLVLESGTDHGPRPFPAPLDTVWKAIQWAEGR